jgi:pyruvate kinase
VKKGALVAGRAPDEIAVETDAAAGSTLAGLQAGGAGDSDPTIHEPEARAAGARPDESNESNDASDLDEAAAAEALAGVSAVMIGGTAGQAVQKNIHKATPARSGARARLARKSPAAQRARSAVSGDLTQTRSSMHRATKIVATIGPASSNPDILLQMMQAGLDVVRFNFSHGTADDHRQRAEWVREAARQVGREVALMADLQGPKIRVGRFENNKTILVAGNPFILDAKCELGNNERVGLDYPDLPRDLRRATCCC